MNNSPVANHDIWTCLIGGSTMFVTTTFLLVFTQPLRFFSSRACITGDQCPIGILLQIEGQMTIIAVRDLVQSAANGVVMLLPPLFTGILMFFSTSSPSSSSQACLTYDIAGLSNSRLMRAIGLTLSSGTMMPEQMSPELFTPLRLVLVCSSSDRETDESASNSYHGVPASR